MSIGRSLKYVYGRPFWTKTLTPLLGAPADVDLQLRRVDDVVARGSAHGRLGVVPGAEPRLAARDGGRRARPRWRRGRRRPAKVNPRPLTLGRSTRRGAHASARPSRCSVASTTSLGMPSMRQKTLVAPPGSTGERRRRPREAVGRLVDRPVAAEGDHGVVALAGRLAAELDRVALALGVDRVDVVAPLQRVEDEVPQAVRHRRGVRVDDDEQPPDARRAGCAAASARRSRAVVERTDMASSTPRVNAGYRRPRLAARSLGVRPRDRRWAPSPVGRTPACWEFGRATAAGRRRRWAELPRVGASSRGGSVAGVRPRDRRWAPSPVGRTPVYRRVVSWRLGTG